MWPIYITIGNLSSKIRNTPNTYAMILIKLLPIPATKKGAMNVKLDLKCAIADDLLQDALKLVFGPFTTLGLC